MQRDFKQHLSVNIPNDDFREFVDTLVVALRQIERAESPIRHIHPVLVREEAIPFPAPAGIESSDRGL